ncbi:conserved hypothetical protein [Theileria orientalis strain Shintoku]|uniref:Uncharacterized protein n=1 Tax=Theileria orientalis strain Shintoku TaxID=869250 RepID=J4DPW6_THEOR|nr:conserved hypothetical protein [Theileria orientalis strain Shintoku]BAM41419.1 conserved hypothetical protein [Theileria orientalis strain Shintoku]|eukprot:XP_009691720.1 conserved hypothetical protein [Theileria orientalis strain Shintoku]
MVRDRLLLEDLEDGKPAIWHRNTLSLINENKFDNLKKSTPTQIVYPNSSFNIGLPVDSSNLQESSTLNNEDQLYDENGNEKPLIVYASNRAENMKSYKKHLNLICLILIYFVAVLYFGGLMKSHVDYTRCSVIYLKITKMSMFLYFSVLVLLILGYSQILRFNSFLWLLLYINFPFLFHYTLYKMQLSIYVLLISQFLLAFCNYTLVPSQVLLPRTSFYRCKKTNQLLSITVQFVLKIEPSLCVNWKLQDSDVLSFDKGNSTALQTSRDLEDSDEPDSYSDNELRGCSSTVVLTTLPLNLKDEVDHDPEESDSSEDEKLELKLEHQNTDVRTFVFAYDSKFRFHAVTEVVISKLDRLTVETAYRKVSRNQVFSLKLRGLDREGNTFSSLEGMPFYMSFAGPRIFDVVEVKEGDLYSEKRSNVLSQSESFALPEGTTLVSDVLLLKGVKVGKSSLAFGLFLDEYAQVVSTPVEFVVNDFVVLSHQNLYMLNKTRFKIELLYPLNHLYQNGKEDKVDPANYEWYTDADPSKVTVSREGVVESHVYLSTESDNGGSDVESEEDPLENGYQCIVYAKDLRTGEVLKSYVNVMKPHSLVLKYSSLRSLNNCLVSKNVMTPKELERGESYEVYLRKLSKLEGQEECFLEQDKSTLYLYEGGFYVFKFNLLTYNKNLFNTFDADATTFGPEDKDKDFEEDELLKYLEGRDNYHMYRASNLGCDYYNLTHINSTGIEDPLMHKFKLCVLQQIKLEGYECNSNHVLQNDYKYFTCEKPLVVSVGDMFEVTPIGGSGKFKYDLAGSRSDSNKFVCSNKGSYQLKITDMTHEENGLLVQVIATTVDSSEFEYTTSEDSSEYVDAKANGELTLRLNKMFNLKLTLYADLTGFKPLYKKSFTREDGKFYSFNYFNDGNHLVSVRQKFENLLQLNEMLDSEEGMQTPPKDVKLLLYDRKVADLKGVRKQESSLVMTFHTLETSRTNFGINLELLTDYYRGQFEEKEEERLSDLFNESKFGTLLLNVYKDPELYIESKYRLPLINLAALTGSETRMADEETELLANVALGEKMELNYRHGLGHTEPELKLTTNNNVLHMEKVEGKRGNEGYMVYCVNVGHEDMAFELLDFRKKYRVNCSFPKYNRVYPVNRVSKGLYELVDAQSAGRTEKFEERKYRVNSDRVNLYMNLMFDEDNNPLLPSEIYASTFEVYAVAPTLTVTPEFWDKGYHEQSILLEDTPVLEFLPSEYEGAKREFKVVGRIIYENSQRNYSAHFNKVRKYRRINQQIKSQVKSRWPLFGKFNYLNTYIIVSPKVNPTLEVAAPEGTSRDLYLMYNRMFVYRVFVSGGSGHYSLVGAGDLNYRFSRAFVFPNALRNSERMDDADTLPELLTDKVVLVNLFDYKSLKGSGRFLTFVPDNMDDLSLVVKDDKLLWHKPLELNLHFKYPNRFQLALEPLTYTNASVSSKEFVLVQGKEEMLYVNEKYKLKITGYYNNSRLLDNTMLWSFTLHNNSMALKSINVFKDYTCNEHLFAGESEQVFRGSDDLVMSTFDLGTSGLSVSDFERSLKGVYKFRLVEKLLLDHAEVTVLTNTKFDMTFRSVKDYSNLEVTALEIGAGTGRDHRLENYGFSFNELGQYKYSVGVMYRDNLLTELDHSMVVNVAKPAKMLFHISGLSGQMPLSKDENMYEYTVDRSTVVNLNVLLFDEKDNMFTPLYLNNQNLEFVYQMTDACHLLTVGATEHNGESNEVVTNRYNVLLYVKGDSEVVVTARYLGVMLQSKKLKFRIRAEEKLFEETGEDDGVAVGMGCGACCGQEEEDNLCYGGVYEINKSFKSYPENKLKHLGRRVYKVVTLGNVLIMTDMTTYNVKLLKPTHFSLVPLNGSCAHRVEGKGHCSECESKIRGAGVDFATSNMNRMAFKLVLYSNGSMLKTPINARFTVSMKDLSVFTYEVEDDLLKLTPRKYGESTLELVYSLSNYEHADTDDEVGGGHERFGSTHERVASTQERVGTGHERADYPELGDNEISRYYLLRSTHLDVTNVVSVLTGSRVYLTGSRVNGLAVNLDVNAYEFTKFLKNKFTVKSFGTCLDEGCGMVYMNKTEYVDTPKKLRSMLSSNRTSYKVLLNVVTNALNALLTKGEEYASFSKEAKSMLSMSQMKDAAHCAGSYCWVELRYSLSSPISVEKLKSVNDNLYWRGDYKEEEDLEEVLRMMSSPLVGVDTSMWNTSSGVLEEGNVETPRPGKYKFRNVNDEEVVAHVANFNASHYKFKQVDNYTVLLLPQSTGGPRGEESPLANHANVLYFNYGLSYKFSDPQLSKLYFLKQTYYPYLTNTATGASLVYRLGYSVLLSNSLHKEWSVFKNHLRTMSTDALKGKRKLTLELHHYTKDTQGGGKEHSELLMTEDLELDLPEDVLFVNSDGFILNELVEENMNNVLHVYPVNSSYKLYLNSNKYVVKTVEKSGQLTTFIVYSNVASTALEERESVYKQLFEDQQHAPGNVYLMVLNATDTIIGKIRINANVPTARVSVARLGLLKGRKLSDVLTLVVTLAVALFVLFVYNTIRNYQYYQPTVPIKLERSLPKVFDSLHQTGYHSRYYRSQR